ncbi:gag-pol polyprotein precursor hypothetical protein, partial [mine drainage metagenome]
MILVSVCCTVFADANPNAIGAVFYLCIGDQLPVFLHSSSQVVKTGTIPKLEFQAMDLALKGALKLLKIHKVDRTVFWSDSTVTIGRLNGSLNDLDARIAVKVWNFRNAINATYRHVPTADNPADLLTRGCSMSSLLNVNVNKHWWTGPVHLMHSIPETVSVNAVTLEDLPTMSENLSSL